MKNTGWLFLYISMFSMVHTKANSQSMLALSGTTSKDANSSFQTYSFAVNHKSLKVVSLVPNFEILYIKNDPYRNGSKSEFSENLSILIPITYSVRPFPKLSINNSIALFSFGTSPFNSASFYRFEIDYLLGNRFMVNLNYQQLLEYSNSNMYGIGASFLVNDYYKSSQEYYLKKRDRYNRKKGAGAFERELEASLAPNDYNLGISVQSDVNSWFYINSLSYSLGLNYQKAGFRGMVYGLRFMYTTTLALSYGVTKNIGTAIFVGEHRTNAKAQFFHGAELGLLGIEKSRNPVAIIGYKIGGGSGDNLLKKQMRIAGFFQINTLGPGLGLELGYFFKE